MYDCIIIGAGVNGAFVARNLSKYNLKVLVIEKENDVGDATSCANSAVIHSGYDPLPKTNKAKFNAAGNKMYDEVCQELDVEFKRIGSITIAITDEEAEILKQLVERADQNGVEVKNLSKDELKRLEPNITNEVKAGILAPTSAIINPFELVVALMENAIDNGVMLHLNEKVLNIDKKEYFTVITDKAEYTSKIVVNAAGVYSDVINNLLSKRKLKITPRKGEYFVLDHFDDNFVKHTIFTIPNKSGKGVLITPTTHNNYLIGPSSDFGDDKEDYGTDKDILNSVMMFAKKMIEDIPTNQIIRSFAGIRAYEETNDFIVGEAEDVKGFINIAGMQSPGLASAPKVAEKITSDILKYFRNVVIKTNYNPRRRPLYRLNKLSIEERNKLIGENSNFGKIVCRCEKVSEGEVVDVIKRNCGATTIKGVKKRIRPGFGKCQGGFCEPLILKILARELNVNPIEIKYNTAGSYILTETNKGDKYD